MEALPLLAAAGSLLLVWPFLFQSPPDIQVRGETVSGGFPHLVEASGFDGGGFVVWYESLRGYDPLLLVAAGAGGAIAMAALLRRRCPSAARRDAAVALAFTLPLALALGVFRHSFERFFLPLAPFLAVLAAVGIAGVARRLGRALSPVGAAAGPMLAILVLALPAYAAGRLAWLRSQRDNLERAAEFRDRLDPAQETSMLGNPRAFLPLMLQLDPTGIEAASPSAWLRYVAEFERAGRPVAGRPFVFFPSALRSAVTPRPISSHVVALMNALPDLGCAWALDILPDRDAAKSSLTEALSTCAEIAWESGGADCSWAENGYQEPDMLHVVLSAPSWGPRLAL